MAGGKGTGTVLVKIAGDASGLNKALSEAELGTSGFASKLGRLGSIAGVGALAAVGAVAGVGAAIFKVGQDFDEAYRQIRASTGATGTELQGLEQSMKNVFAKTPADMGDVATAISKVHQRLDLVGKPLEETTLSLLRLSRITKTDLNATLESATGLFNQFGVAGGDQTKVLDELFRAGQASGQGVGELMSQLTSAGPTLRAVGFNLDSSVALLAQLSKNGIDSGSVIAGLRKEFGKFAKAGKDPAEALQALIGEIKDAPDPIHGMQKAVEVFGARAGSQMFDVIRSGKFDISAMLDIVRNGKDTLASAGKDVATMGGAWKLLSHNLMVIVEPIATRVFGAVSQGVMAFTGAIRGLMDAFKSGGTEGFAKALDDMAGGGGRVHDAVIEVVHAFEAVGKWFADHKDEILGVLGSIAQVGATAVVGGIEAVGGAFKFISDNFQVLAPLAAALLTTFIAYEAYIKTVAAIEAATKLWAAAQALVNLVMSLNPIVLAITIIAALAAALVTAYKTSDKFREHVDKAIDGIQAAYNGMASAVTEVLRILIVNTLDWAEQAVAAAAAAFGWVPGLGDKLEQAHQAVATMKDNVNARLGEIRDKFTVTAQVHAQDAIQQIQYFKDAVLSVPNVVVTEFATQTRVGAGAAIPGFASGGTASGWAMVGEKGPELANFGSPTRIYPSGTGPGATYNVTVNALSPNPADISKTVISAIQEHERRNGSGWRNN